MFHCSYPSAWRSSSRSDAAGLRLVVGQVDPPPLELGEARVTLGRHRVPLGRVPVVALQVGDERGVDGGTLEGRDGPTGAPLVVQDDVVALVPRVAGPAEGGGAREAGPARRDDDGLPGRPTRRRQHDDGQVDRAAVPVRPVGGDHERRAAGARRVVSRAGALEQGGGVPGGDGGVRRGGRRHRLDRRVLGLRGRRRLFRGSCRRRDVTARRRRPGVVVTRTRRQHERGHDGHHPDPHPAH